MESIWWYLATAGVQVLKSHGQDYLVGNELSRADIHLVEFLYYMEELDSSLISSFPLLKENIKQLLREELRARLRGWSGKALDLQSEVQADPTLTKCAAWDRCFSSLRLSVPIFNSDNRSLFPGLLQKAWRNLQETAITTEKPKLHYLNARGRTESIRWLLAAAGVEFEEKFLESAEDLDKLRNDGSLLFQQVPMVEIDGMKLVQTRAILNYIASKYNLYGKDIKERALYGIFSVLPSTANTE
ncbi:hypothetical protein H8959_010409 [Pygathrix nigripes]